MHAGLEPGAGVSIAQQEGMAPSEGDEDSTFDFMMDWLESTFPSEVAAADDLLGRLLASIVGKPAAQRHRALRGQAAGSTADAGAPQLRLVSRSR